MRIKLKNVGDLIYQLNKMIQENPAAADYQFYYGDADMFCHDICDNTDFEIDEGKKTVWVDYSDE